ncbi:hypothetical protein AB6A40_001696 [Gnathostoma spinigerum]|uniref:RING-type domain-containing protein n=1 Tax=Gnathostoma spinigerum TaxID=75299 RepID=A0ABD6EE67_9BILA
MDSEINLFISHKCIDLTLWAVNVFERCGSIVLRLPFVLLLEIWWKNRDICLINDFFANLSFFSCCKVDRIVEFIQMPNLGRPAMVLFSFSVVLFLFFFLLLSLHHMVQVYSHGISLFFLGVASSLSMNYVASEQPERSELKLDRFSRLEKHAFYLIAQLALCLAQTYLIELESSFSYAMLAVFLAPFIAYICGYPGHRLMYSHNIACSLTVVFIFFYMIRRIPRILGVFKNVWEDFRNTLLHLSLIEGFTAIGSRIHFVELLTTAWVSIFFLRMLLDVTKNERSLSEIGIVILLSVAEATSTPLSLLAFILVIIQMCTRAECIARVIIGSSNGHSLFFTQITLTEALAVVSLCLQTGFLGMPTQQKAFLVGFILFIATSVLLQSLYELLKPHLLCIAASHTSSRRQHLYSLILAFFLFTAPLYASFTVMRFLPVDLWCCLLVCNCTLTSVRTLSVGVIYVLTVIDSCSSETWKYYEDTVFKWKLTTQCIEILMSSLIVIHGIYSSFRGQWTFPSIVVLLFHTYLNVWSRSKEVLASITAHYIACKNISYLRPASNAELLKMRDVCSICFSEMITDARVTPCHHYFHSFCLRKWLTVKLVCPLCYTVVGLSRGVTEKTVVEPFIDSDEEITEYSSVDVEIRNVASVPQMEHSYCVSSQCQLSQRFRRPPINVSE